MRFFGVLLALIVLLSDQVCGIQTEDRQAGSIVDKASEPDRTDSATEAPIQELVAVATLSYNNPLQVHSAKVQIPSLEAGKRYRLALQLVNPGDQEISFDRVELQCSCMKMKVKDKVIPPNGGIGEMEFMIDAPIRTKKSSVAYMARFVEIGASRPSMILNLHVDLNNMFSIEEDHVQLNFLPEQTDLEVKVPVLLVPPVTLSQLELVASDKVRDLGLELLENADGAFVRVVVNRNNLIGDALAGEIAVRRRGTMDSDGFLLTVRSANTIDISPDSLRLVRGVGDASSEFLGGAVLRVTPDDNNEDRPLLPEVKLEIDGHKATVELKRLGQSNVYRVRIRVEEREKINEEDSVKIKWVLSNGKEMREIKSYAYFSN